MTRMLIVFGLLWFNSIGRIAAQQLDFQFHPHETNPDLRVLKLHWQPGYGMVLERSSDLINWESVDWHYSSGTELTYELFDIAALSQPTPPPSGPPVSHAQFTFQKVSAGGILVIWPRPDQEPGRAHLPGLSLGEHLLPVYGREFDDHWNLTLIYMGEFSHPNATHLLSADSDGDGRSDFATL